MKIAGNLISVVQFLIMNFVEVSSVFSAEELIGDTVQKSNQISTAQVGVRGRGKTGVPVEKPL